MSMITIVLFFVYCYGLGFTISSFVKNSENFLERNLMRIGFGLSLLPLLAIALNMAKIPADWRVMLLLSLAYPIYYLLRNYNKFHFAFKLTKADLSIFAMLIIFLINFYVYASGAFSYPYLEDDDSWSHALGVKYIAMGNNAFDGAAQYIKHINPYPPSYDITMGILSQTNGSIYWTLKFFNALIIALSTVFFYFFVKELTGDRNKALFAAFALFSIPAFMSHFIWAISLSVTLYFVAFYAMERIKHDKKWWIAAGLVMFTPLTSSPTHSTYFGLIFVLYFIAKTISEKKFLAYDAIAGIMGILLSAAFWWIPMILSHGVFGTLKGLGIMVESGVGALSVGGTGDKPYTFGNFFFAQRQNMINNPIGIGVILALLAVVALIYILFKYSGSLKKNKKIISASFLILTVIMVFLLFSTYNKDVWDEGRVLPIPFNVFISDQLFLVISLTFSIMVFLALITANYADKDFKDGYLIIALTWLIFLFYAVNAAPFKFKLSPFRSWMLLAIPVCILASEGALALTSTAKRYAGNIGKYAVLILLIIGVYFTSTQQKIAVNTANWPPGGFWTSGEEIGAYLWMKDSLPKNSHVFSFWNNGPIIGLDMYTCHWCKDVRDYMKEGFNQSAQQNHDWLAKRKYEYVIIDGQTVKRFGANESIQKMQEFVRYGLFQPVFQNQGAVIFKIL